MGACNSSTSSQAAHSLGQSCGRRLRNKRARQLKHATESSSSSTASELDQDQAKVASDQSIRSIPIKLSGESVSSADKPKQTTASDIANTTAPNANKTTSDDIDNNELRDQNSDPAIRQQHLSDESKSSTSTSSSSVSSQKEPSSRGNSKQINHPDKNQDIDHSSQVESSADKLARLQGM